MPDRSAEAGDEMTHVVVVGAAAAGLAAVEELRHQGFASTISVVGEEIHPPYDRPPLSKQLLKSVDYDSQVPLRSAEDLRRTDARFLLGHRATALALDRRQVILDGGQTLEFDGLVIATGIRPRTIPGTRLHVLRTLDDARALRAKLRPMARVVVIGAGLLGCEIAASAVTTGCQVTLLDHGSAPLTTALGPLIGMFITDLHNEHGVRVVSNSTVVSADHSTVVLSSGEVLEADIVVACIGSEPATEWLTGSGLPLDDGVLCDSTCAAARGVVAAGDVARWFNPGYGVHMRVEHRTNATLQGAHAARTLLAEMAGGSGEPFVSVPYSWSDQFGVRIQTHGYLRGYDEIEIVAGRLAEKSFIAAYRSLGRIVGVVGINAAPRDLRAWQLTVRSTTAEFAESLTA